MFRRCQWLCVIGKQKYKITDLKEWVVELLKYTDGTVFIEEFKSWELPRFPLSGAVLKDHGVPGIINISYFSKQCNVLFPF